MLEFVVGGRAVGGRAVGKTYGLRETIRRNFKCGCMTDELLDSLMSEGTSLEKFECKHGLSITFGKRR